ncbi:hypothetical protein [Paenibacillus cremeus]|uniref:Uncharacterized protein n=1 Tax=Paenibacillus cremeus TaxID=2163881 RepID=A0A559K3Q1_9BACL|nr:hypothetical protein [Paenibacillus cremeus]TVY06762.1 hypothetical protein FPZ49_27655 [Paenibacillus cremeus]
MKQPYGKKVIVSALALALLLGFGALYGTSQLVLADPSDPAVQSSAPSSDAPQDQTSKLSRLKEWFGKRGEKQDEKSKDGKHAGKSLPIFDEAAAILGMDKAALQAALKEKTLVQLAAEKNISEADLIAKLQAERSKKIDEAVAAGKLTADKAKQLKDHLAEHLSFMVNHKFTGEGMHGHGKHGFKHRMMPAPEKLAAILGITEDELKAQLKSGKSLADIAQSKGMTKDQLISKIKDEMTPWIEKMVDRKHVKEDKNPK